MACLWVGWRLCNDTMVRPKLLLLTRTNLLDVGDGFPQKAYDEQDDAHDVASLASELCVCPAFALLRDSRRVVNDEGESYRQH